ncbi:uncharacterized protein LOC134456037 [Engraulis encrasicolus]|uniref:uncharacterized protein LOC134456037 n=1 Tax=Engraulis encrasicolus TaxID=184585 RepID=UPI002FD47D26
MDNNGNIIPPEAAKKDLKEKRDKVQTELQTVFGVDLEYDIIDEEKESSINILVIVLGIAIPVVVIAIIIAVVIGVKKQKQKKKSDPQKPTNKRRESRDSLENKPPSSFRNPAMQTSMQRQMERHSNERNMIQMNRFGNPNPAQPTYDRNWRPAMQTNVQRRMERPYQMNQFGNLNQAQPTNYENWNPAMQTNVGRNGMEYQPGPHQKNQHGRSY